MATKQRPARKMTRSEAGRKGAEARWGKPSTRQTTKSRKPSSSSSLSSRTHSSRASSHRDWGKDHDELTRGSRNRSIHLTHRREESERGNLERSRRGAGASWGRAHNNEREWGHGYAQRERAPQRQRWESPPERGRWSIEEEDEDQFMSRSPVRRAQDYHEDHSPYIHRSSHYPQSRYGRGSHEDEEEYSRSRRGRNRRSSW